MRKLMTIVSIRMVLALWFIVLFLVAGGIPKVRGQETPSVEGTWLVTSEPPDIVSPDLGKSVMIRRKGLGEYEVIWPQQGKTIIYSGISTEIRFIETQTYDKLKTYFKGMGIQDSVLREAVGAKVTYYYILSPDGRSMRFLQERLNLRYYASSGHLLSADILPPSGPPTILTRVSENKKTETAAVAQVESRGEFYFLTKDGRKLTGKEANQVPLEEGTKVVTGSSGHVQMKLPDDTTFTVGPNSDMVIDKFVYDPSSDSRAITANLAKGVFRWVTGKVVRKDPTAMKVKVPVGFIGIRGTDFETTVNSDSTGHVMLYFGQLEITEKKTGFTFVLNPGEKVIFGVDGSISRPMKAE